MDSDPDLALPDLGLAAAAEGFVAVAGGDDRLPRVRFEGASRVEAISAACREAASEASSAVVFEREKLKKHYEKPVNIGKEKF